MKLLFFAPFSGIWEHSELEARLAGALQRNGHEVTYVTCGGILHRHCVVMAAKGLAASAPRTERDAVCKTCRARARAIRAEFGLRGPQIEDLLDREELDRIEQALAVDAAPSLVELTWRGVPVGRKTLFPFLVYQKKDDLNLSDPQWREYGDQLHQTMVAVSAAQVILDRHKPDSVVTYSATYSVVSSFLDAARTRGIRTYFVEATGNLAHRMDRAIFARDGILQWFKELRLAWPRFERRPANPAHLAEAGDHAVSLFRGASIFSYSTAAGSDAGDIRAAVGAPPGSRILLATMSSYDEWFAAEMAGLSMEKPAAFGSQLEWLDWLLDFTARNPQVHLVVRVHPREFPTQRSALTSSHAVKLRERLSKLPPNCFINWPSQKLSLYDLAKVVDVVLNAWSSAGKEMGLLGLPVVEWAPDVLLYPPELDYCARTPQEYAARVQRALDEGWREGRIRRMLRWCALEFGAASFSTHQNGSAKSGKAPLLLRIARRLARARMDAWVARRNSIPPASLKQVEHTVAEGLPLLIADQDGDAGTEARMLGLQVRRMADALSPGASSRGAPEHGSDGLIERLLLAASRLEEQAEFPEESVHQTAH